MFEGKKEQLKIIKFVCLFITTAFAASGIALRKRICIHSVISVNYHYITLVCPFNLLIRFKYYNTV